MLERMSNMMNLNGLTKIFTGNGGTIRFAIAGVTILGIVGTCCGT